MLFICCFSFFFFFFFFLLVCFGGCCFLFRFSLLLLLFFFFFFFFFSMVIFFSCLFFFSEEKTLCSCNCILRRQFAWNANDNVLEKKWEKYLKLSSAELLYSMLIVKVIFTKSCQLFTIYISASTWKALQGAYHHSERSTTASGRQVPLPWKHIVKSRAHWWWSQCQDCQS